MSDGRSSLDASRAEWFVAVGSHWIGPLTAAEVRDKLGSGEVVRTQLCWRKGEQSWRPLHELPVFQAAEQIVPPPLPEMVQQVETRAWFLHLSGKSYGPYSTRDVEIFLSEGKIQGSVHAWREGMAAWEKLERLGLFDQHLKPQPPILTLSDKDHPASEAIEHREAQRRPWVARILLTNDQAVIEAVCQDISAGGMRVLTDRIPGEIGDKIKLNVSPTEEKGRIKAFVAEGRIVRKLGDAQGFSFRFERLSENAKRAIEEFTHSAA